LADDGCVFAFLSSGRKIAGRQLFFISAYGMTVELIRIFAASLRTAAGRKQALES
jgi:hypothetical protein